MTRNVLVNVTERTFKALNQTSIGAFKVNANAFLPNTTIIQNMTTKLMIQQEKEEYLKIRLQLRRNK